MNKVGMSDVVALSSNEPGKPQDECGTDVGLHRNDLDAVTDGGQLLGKLLKP